MKISKIQKGLVLLTITAGVFAAGCELIVDFDRTKIPVETPDTGVPDVNVPETSTPGDGGSDAGDGGSNTSDAGDADADA
ncbi:MAG: hypothetical protein K0S65_2691 [Labilithrix sp.]|nr:hypothetical protein [Labilithrix sp.]